MDNTHYLSQFNLLHALETDDLIEMEQLARAKKSMTNG